LALFTTREHLNVKELIKLYDKQLFLGQRGHWYWV